MLMLQFEISSVSIAPPPAQRCREQKVRENTKRWQRFWQFSFSLSLSFLSLCGGSRPVLAAERLLFSYPPFGDFSLSVDSLERFAQEGTVTPELEFYLRRLEPQQIEQLQVWLQTRWDVSPVAMAQVTYSAFGETVLRRLGEAVRTESDLNSFHALRSALILAAASSDGLTLASVLRQFPIDTIKIDLNLASVAIAELSGTLGDKEAVLAVIRQQAKATSAIPLADVQKPREPQSLGQYRWQQETISFRSPRHKTPAIADLYRPLVASPLPVLVITHGIGSDRQTFAYLAEHLASQGFFVAILEHPESNSLKLTRFLASLDRAPNPRIFVNQPLEISALLDELARRDRADPTLRLNLERVGVIGQSLGGYAALVVGGAEINEQKLRHTCKFQQSFEISFNLSQLLQCQAASLPNLSVSLQDERIQAVLAINPTSSRILGEKGLSKLSIPIAIVASENDILTPIISEQIYPFTWLKTENKYLIVVEGGTHFSFIGGEGESAFPVPSPVVGPSPDRAYPYLTALSTAFFKTHIALETEYRTYLNQEYAASISREPFNLHLIQSLSAEMLAEPMADVAQLLAW